MGIQQDPEQKVLDNALAQYPELGTGWHVEQMLSREVELFDLKLDEVEDRIRELESDEDLDDSAVVAALKEAVIQCNLPRGYMGVTLVRLNETKQPSERTFVLVDMREASE